jgi:exodeoxyribonuclease VII small subunit
VTEGNSPITNGDSPAKPGEQPTRRQAPDEQAEALSYEQARDELAAVVKRLETGGLTLEQSLDLWERGERLAAICGEWLEGARARLTTAMAHRSNAPRDADAPF